MNSFANKKVLVTGAQGFIGVHLCRKLRNAGAIVATLHQRKTDDYQKYSFVGDIQDSDFVKSICSQFQPEYFFHLAGYKGRTIEIEDFRQALDVNLIGTLNIVQALLEVKSLKRLVAVGTAEEYGLGGSPFKSNQREMPITSYSFSKVCMTQLLQTMNRLYKLPVVILRPSIAYGPGQGTDMFLPALIKSLLDGQDFQMTSGSQKRDFIYIDDLLNALVAACFSEFDAGEIYNVASAENITIAKVALKVGELLERTDLIKFGELPGRKLDIHDYAVDIRKTNEELNWHPTVSLKTGLSLTIDAFKQGRHQ